MFFCACSLVVFLLIILSSIITLQHCIPQTLMDLQETSFGKRSSDVLVPEKEQNCLLFLEIENFQCNDMQYFAETYL